MVLVMDNGLAAEWGRPATLLDNPNGTFTSMPSVSHPPPLPRLPTLPSLPPCLHGWLLHDWLLHGCCVPVVLSGDLVRRCAENNYP